MCLPITVFNDGNKKAEPRREKCDVSDKGSTRGNQSVTNARQG